MTSNDDTILQFRASHGPETQAQWIQREAAKMLGKRLSPALVARIIAEIQAAPDRQRHS